MIETYETGLKELTDSDIVSTLQATSIGTLAVSVLIILVIGIVALVSFVRNKSGTRTGTG